MRAWGVSIRVYLSNCLALLHLSYFNRQLFEVVFCARNAWYIIFYLSILVAATLILPNVAFVLFFLSPLDEETDTLENHVSEAFTRLSFH